MKKGDDYYVRHHIRESIDVMIITDQSNIILEVKSVVLAFLRNCLQGIKAGVGIRRFDHDRLDNYRAWRELYSGRLYACRQ